SDVSVDVYSSDRRRRSSVGAGRGRGDVQAQQQYAAEQGQRYRQAGHRPPAFGPVQEGGRGFGQPAGQQQAGRETQVDQAAEAGPLAAGQPFQHQRRRQHEHQAVADAVGQAQQQQAEDIRAERLGQGDGGVGQQRQGQGDA